MKILSGMNAMCAINNSLPSFKVSISKITSEVFRKYRQVNTRNEACGILIGTHSIDGLNIRTLYATEPDSGDERGRFFFKIKSDKHNAILQERFKLSHNQEVYLGTWHTHPEDHPSPSQCDQDNWLKQYHANTHLFETMLFAIVGRKTNKWFIINNGEIIPLKDDDIQYEDRGLL